MKKTSQEILNIPSSFLLFIAFAEGASVMAVELIGAKMAAPYFGSTHYVWTAVLAVTLIGLTSGYYIGGKLSEAKNRDQLFFPILSLAAIGTLILPIISPNVMENFMHVDFRLAALFSTMFFLFPVLLIFGLIPPLVISKLTENVQSSGEKTGLTYAISTIGGVFMTLITAFLLIPSIGLRFTAVLVGVLFALLPIYHYVSSAKWMKVLALVLLIGFFVFSNTSISSKAKKSGPQFSEIYQAHGLLGFINIIDYPYNQTRALFTNNISQSYVHKPTARSQWTYVHRLSTYTSFKPEGSKVFLVGLGAGNVVTEFKLLKFDVTVCDIEKRMAHIARTFFGMIEPDKIIIDDARHALNVETEKYDIIVLDVSAGESQPNNLYTIESFKRIKEMLKEDGIFFVHYPTYINHEHYLALKCITKTMKEAGFNVDLINTYPSKDMVAEMIVFASKNNTRLHEQDYSRRDLFAESFGFPKNTMEVYYQPYDDSDGFILTDDKPIMDKLHFGVSEKHRVDGLNVTIKGMLDQGFKMF
jgi:spermidine synthase